MHDRGFHPLLGLLCMVALGALVGLGVWLVLRRRPSAASPVVAATPLAPTAPASPTASAEVILAERLARGEIDPDDYRTRLDALRGVVAAATPGPDATTD